MDNLFNKGYFCIFYIIYWYIPKNMLNIRETIQKGGNNSPEERVRNLEEFYFHRVYSTSLNVRITNLETEILGYPQVGIIDHRIDILENEIQIRNSLRMYQSNIDHLESKIKDIINLTLPDAVDIKDTTNIELLKIKPMLTLEQAPAEDADAVLDEDAVLGEGEGEGEGKDTDAALDEDAALSEGEGEGEGTDRDEKKQLARANILKLFVTLQEILMELLPQSKVKLSELEQINKYYTNKHQYELHNKNTINREIDEINDEIQRIENTIQATDATDPANTPLLEQLQQRLKELKDLHSDKLEIQDDVEDRFNEADSLLRTVNPKYNSAQNLYEFIQKTLLMIKNNVLNFELMYIIANARYSTEKFAKLNLLESNIISQVFPHNHVILQTLHGNSTQPDSISGIEDKIDEIKQLSELNFSDIISNYGKSHDKEQADEESPENIVQLISNIEDAIKDVEPDKDASVVGEGQGQGKDEDEDQDEDEDEDEADGNMSEEVEVVDTTAVEAVKIKLRKYTKILTEKTTNIDKLIATKKAEVRESIVNDSTAEMGTNIFKLHNEISTKLIALIAKMQEDFNVTLDSQSRLNSSIIQEKESVESIKTSSFDDFPTQIIHDKIVELRKLSKQVYSQIDNLGMKSDVSRTFLPIIRDIKLYNIISLSDNTILQKLLESAFTDRDNNWYINILQSLKFEDSDVDNPVYSSGEDQIYMGTGPVSDMLDNPEYRFGYSPPSSEVIEDEEKEEEEDGDEFHMGGDEMFGDGGDEDY